MSTEPRSRPAMRSALRGLTAVAVMIVVSAVAIAVALSVTPPRPVEVLGQRVAVGATPPSLTASGPGEVVLFGRRIPTEVEFVGPVRPRLVLTDITIDAQVTGAFAPPGRDAATAAVGEALAAGWRRFFLWQSAVVGLTAVLLLGAVAGWRRLDRRNSFALIVGGLVVAQLVNAGAIMVTAFTAPETLRGVRSLTELVGRDEVRPIPAAAGPEAPGVQAVVLGDSVAAGLGGPPVPDEDALDEACQRSAASFARTLALVNDWEVANLACSGATVDAGILGPQFTGGRRVPPQLAAAKRGGEADVVIVNVGANDLEWSTLVFLCGAAEACDDRAQTAFFQRSLDDFTQDYYELLQQLAVLPGDPLVLINRYYAPFDPDLDCLEPLGLTPEKLQALLERLDALNDVLEAGAATFGFASVQPEFRGHELCTDAPYVQDVDDAAPLHPNARGQLAIALANERALLEAGAPVG